MCLLCVFYVYLCVFYVFCLSLTTTGAAAVPPGATVLMLYDGEKWVNIEALRAPMAELRQVQVCV
jgi:hypothetical protein